MTAAGTSEYGIGAPFLDDGSSHETGSRFETPNLRYYEGKKALKDMDDDEKAQRSRERNRVHARKTRQRKKEQMQNLQQRADALKAEQLRLKQVINDKSTASILVDLFAKKSPTRDDDDEKEDDNPAVEALLRRHVEDIPDVSHVPELPSLILPGQHASKTSQRMMLHFHLTTDDTHAATASPDDEINYELLGKDRSKCSPEELEEIRKERNRMHAKRTRDRKRRFLEEVGEICRQLEDENELLRAYLTSLDPYYVFERDKSLLVPLLPHKTSKPSSDKSTKSSMDSSLDRHVAGDQLQTLLAVADTIAEQEDDIAPTPRRKRTHESSSKAAPAVSGSESDNDENEEVSNAKRIRASSVPDSITMTTIGC